MHRGNVLVRRTKEEFIYFRMDHKDYHIKSYGVRATIVDYTLSRVTQKGIYTHVYGARVQWGHCMIVYNNTIIIIAKQIQNMKCKRKDQRRDHCTNNDTNKKRVLE